MAKKRQYTDEVKAAIVAARLSGTPGRELCREYGISESMLYRWIKQAKEAGGLPEPPTPPKRARGGARGISTDTSTYPCDELQTPRKRTVAQNGKKFTLETNVPLPYRSGVEIYPIDAMELGESFEVKRAEHKKITYAAAKFSKKERKEGGTRQVVVRQMPNGNYRCFRVR